MKYWIVGIIACLVSLLLPAAVVAQDGLILKSLHISIFPEYDRTEALVIYRITLPDNQSIPVELTFRLPEGVDEPYNVAMQDVDNMLYSLEYHLSTDAQGKLVTFTALSPKSQIEYYDGHLVYTGNEREFFYNWTGDYTVENMSIQMQEPATASRFQVIPDMGSTYTGDDHLTYYTLEVGEVEAGITFTVKLDYEKPDDELSIHSLSVQPIEPIPQPATIDIANENESLIPGIMSALGILFIAGGVLWYHKSGRTSNYDRGAQNSKRHRDSSLTQDELIPIYCHRCGKKAKSGDLYCRACGSKLRF